MILIEDNMKVTYRNDIKKEYWKEWKYWKDCTEEEKKKVNLRQLRDDEIVIDDDENKSEEILKKIKKDGFDKYTVVEANRGNHIHLLFDNLTDLDIKIRSEIRKIFIMKYGGDISKTSQYGLISIENKPHFKSEKMCRIVEEKEGFNTLPFKLISDATKKLLDYINKKHPAQPIDAKFKTYTKNDPLFRYISNNKIKEGTQRNNIIFKNVAIALTKQGLDDKQIEKIMKPIIEKNFEGKRYSEFEGWVRRARFDSEFDEYNYSELNRWGKLYIKREFYNLDNILITQSKEFKDIIKLADPKMLAIEFIKRIPIYYDENKIFWMWDKNEYKWRKVDDTALLVSIEEHSYYNTINSTKKMEIIEALKQQGRINKPREPEKTWIQFKDKIVDIKTGEIFDATPQYFIFNPIPWELGESEETPTLDKLFREWVVNNKQNESYINTLYEIVAYTLLPSMLLKRVFCLVGSGNNGKSTFENVLEKFLGNDNVTATDMNMLSSASLARFEYAKLYKKLLVIIGEIDTSIFEKTSILKRLTGDDLCRCEFKGKDNFDFHNYAKPIIACNTLPHTTDKTVGFYRRWVIVNFDRVFPKEVDIISTIPEEEFNNLGRKCVRILREIVKRGTIVNEGTPEEKEKRYEEHSNPIIKFIEDYYEKDSTGETPLTYFCDRFNSYLQERRMARMSNREINNILTKLGYQTRRINIYGEKHTTRNMIIGLKQGEEEENQFSLSNL